MVVLAELLSWAPKKGRKRGGKEGEKSGRKAKGETLLATSLVLSCSVFSVGDSTIFSIANDNEYTINYCDMFNVYFI
jgi:hypothetical protein